MSFFSRLWDVLQGIFSQLEVEALDFVSELAIMIASTGGGILIAAAKTAVEAAEATGASGAEKFEQAFDAIKQTLEDAGLDVVEIAVRGAIEAAVAKLKS